MKNTGVIRKIDELGRIVIPKEIRKNLNVRNGEDLQIFVEEDKIILKKHQKMMSIVESAKKYIASFSKLTNSKLLITDKEKVIASSGNIIIDAKIDNMVVECISNRKTSNGKGILFEKDKLDSYYLIMPIIVDADAIGSVIVLSDREVNDQDKVLISVIKILLESLIY